MAENKAIYAKKEYLREKPVLQGGPIAGKKFGLIGLTAFTDRIVAILILFAVWETMPRLGFIDPFLLPPLSTVLYRTFLLVLNGKLFVHLLSSFQRSFAGFSIAMLISIPVGFFIAWSKGCRKYVDPVMQVFRSIPILALYPVFILFFGLSEGSKIGIITYGAAWPTLLNTISGVNGVDAMLVKGARSMGISKPGLFFKVILPAAFPSILTGVRLSAASSILLLVAAEMLGARTGLGYLIFYSEEKFDIPEMFGGIIMIAAIGFAINYLLLYLEKRLTTWKQNPAGE